MARLSDILNRYNLHTFSPDGMELSEEEAQRAEECCGYIRGLLQKGWHRVTGNNEQITIEDATAEYLAEKERRDG